MSSLVPIIDLLDIDTEPSDAQLESLMCCVRDEAVKKASIANTRLNMMLLNQVNASWNRYEQHNASQGDAGYG
jgi:hypothetical protein